MKGGKVRDKKVNIKHCALQKKPYKIFFEKAFQTQQDTVFAT